MGMKLSEDGRYARELGLPKSKHGQRTITRLGGAEKLRSLSPEARNILLRNIIGHDEQVVENEEILVEQ